MTTDRNALRLGIPLTEEDLEHEDRVNNSLEATKLHKLDVDGESRFTLGTLIVNDDTFHWVCSYFGTIIDEVNEFFAVRSELTDEECLIGAKPETFGNVSQIVAILRSEGFKTADERFARLSAVN